MTNEWEEIHKSRPWGKFPDIHCVRQVSKFIHYWADGKPAFIVSPKALDIGCGVGACSIMMADRGMMVTAIDSSPTAMGRFPRHDGIFDTQIADAQTVEFPAESFDFILDNLSLTYLQEPPWNRIMSWLKPGGWLIHASFEEAPKGTPKAWHHLSPGHVVERHTSWVEGNAFSFVVRKYVKPS